MLRRSLLLAMATAAILVLPSTASAAPTAVMAKNCPHGAKKGQSFGPMYVTNVSARRTSCGKARRLIKSYHRAGAGNRRVKGYRCRQRVISEGIASFDARVTCKRGRKRVKHLYTEST